MMWRYRIFSFVLFGVACGDVPRAPKQLQEPAQTQPEAGAYDAATSCGDAGPTGPVPASMECINCAVTSCFDQGSACVGDPVCQTCISDVTLPTCAQNDLWKKLLVCLCDPMGAAPALCGTECRPECALR